MAADEEVGANVPLATAAFSVKVMTSQAPFRGLSNNTINWINLGGRQFSWPVTPTAWPLANPTVMTTMNFIEKSLKDAHCWRGEQHSVLQINEGWVSLKSSSTVLALE